MQKLWSNTFLRVWTKNLELFTASSYLLGDER